MTVSVNVSFKGLDNLKPRFKSGQRLATNQAMMEMDDYIPKREGYLRDSQTMSKDVKTISYHTPYARAQFYGFVGSKSYPVKHYTTSGTGKRWDLRLKDNEEKMKNVEKAFIGGAKLGLNRTNM